jgi:endoglucanase
MTTRRAFVLSGLSASLAASLPAAAPSGLQRATPASGWPLWERYAARLVDADGRVIDHSANGHTTSEGQAYGLFFSLVAGDRARFDRILAWSQNNLSGGELALRLPAWLYGRGPGGVETILDANPASDADLWMAYALLQAGRIWNTPRYAQLGQGLAARVAELEVRQIPGLGPMLLPGSRGFNPAPGLFQLNPSYLPLQLFYGLAQAQPQGPWRRVAENVPRVIQGAAPAGVALDWIAFQQGHGYVTMPVPVGDRPRASYDAIRVYLWAGMLDPGTPGRWQTLQSLRGMLNHLKSTAFPAAALRADGSVEDANSPLGYSAAVLPFVSALEERQILERQRMRVKARLEMNTAARYYDMCLALFGLGWIEGRYRFDAGGNLVLGGGPR